jgi:probable selenium-dependent hydroxylase accessory protein YqeC
MNRTLGLRPFVSPLTALVGAGGKTTTMFALARGFAAMGKSVLVTTTTRLADHRLDPAPPYDRILLLPGLARAGAAMSDDIAQALSEAARPGICLLASGALAGEVGTGPGQASPPGGKLVGIDPGALAFLRGLFDLVLYEADGSRGLPLKVPGPGEPVLGPGTGAVFGLVGLDCLERPVLPGLVHRPEGFEALGISLGSAIGQEELARIALSPLGLFKASPPGARRVIILNKAELLPKARGEDLAEALAGLPGIEAVALASQLDPMASLLKEAVVYSRLSQEQP